MSFYRDATDTNAALDGGVRKPKGEPMRSKGNTGGAV